jgi:cytochrome c oxidase subunit 4
MRETRSILVIWLALMLLLAMTVAGSFVFTGPFNILVSWGTALIKAALILWFYMHLNEASGIPRLMAVGAIAWLAILFIMTTADYATRIAGY